jgi:polysaccharide pyruvyl transferase CsaB
VRVLVAAWIGSTNLGDELVFAGTRQLLAERGVEVCAISVDPTGTRSDHGVGAVSHTDLPGLVTAAGGADAMVFGGGGLLQDDSSVANLPYHLARIGLARTRGVPFIGLGLGVGGLRTRSGRWLVARAMRAAVGITVRDEASRRLLEEVGVPGSQLTADLAFALEAPVDPGAAGGSGDRLVVCLRSWSGATKRLPAATRGDATPEEHVAALAKGLDEASAATGTQVRFVALQPDRDDALHRRVAERMTAPVELRTPTTARLLGEFVGARAVISMRYHGAVAATLAGRPSVLISYAGKVDSLGQELGAGGRRLDWDPAALATIPGALASVIDEGAAVLAARDRLRARQRGNARLLDHLLEVAS